ncbi:MAG: MaoC family dehydratase N-terminal domain-containing protein [Alphaproteobacteria bacterium]|nr:MaoC family dehydratase N-terminal domain-containing protein [Alphaproteobacteria bacterium]
MKPEDWSAWIGRTETVVDTIAPRRVAALAATLDEDAAPGPGAALPPGWHWLFFNPAVRRRELGSDGHPRRGGFLPPIALPRRMWAGGRLRYDAPLTIGAEASRLSEIVKIDSKTGRSGALTFVTVRHTITEDGRRCIEEEQDIVYRSPPPPDAGAPPRSAVLEGAEWSEEIWPDTTLLFRYSALTFNGHRIHYDQAYAVHEEGYSGLVVHGPLTATLLQGLAARARPAWRLARFSFRGLAPLLADRPFRIEAGSADGRPYELTLWARGADGSAAMEGTAVFEAP